MNKWIHVAFLRKCRWYVSSFSSSGFPALSRSTELQSQKVFIEQKRKYRTTISKHGSLFASCLTQNITLHYHQSIAAIEVEEYKLQRSRSSPAENTEIAPLLLQKELPLVSGTSSAISSFNQFDARDPGLGGSLGARGLDVGVGEVGGDGDERGPGEEEAGRGGALPPGRRVLQPHHRLLLQTGGRLDENELGLVLQTLVSASAGHGRRDGHVYAN